MKGTVFYNTFYFTEYRYERYHHTDASDGASRHFIGLLEQGRCRIVSDKVTIEAGPGEPFYIPMELPYQSYWFSEGKVRLRSYGFDDFPENTGHSYSLQKLPPEFADEIRTIPLCRRPDSGALAAFFAVLHRILPHMERVGEETSGCVFEQAMLYMERHTDCRVSQVARHCGVSESALYASFKRHGTTPNAARQELLAKEAVRLLSTTDLPVQEISDQLGFSSSSYFRKVLHAQTGKTPTQLRKSAARV